MKSILTLGILFTLICFKTNAQTTKPVLKFKNSILYSSDKKIYSYKPNGEIVFFGLNDKIEMKGIIKAPNGNPINLDTLNLDTLNYKLGMIARGKGQYQNWIWVKNSYYGGKGNVERTILYSNGGRTGSSTSFDKNGKTIEKGNYINNNKEGEWLKFDENGKIARKENYKDGVQVEQIYYFPNGKIAETHTGGIEIRYHENGNTAYKKELKNGTGLEIEYNKIGHILKRNTYENGKIIIVEQVGFRAGRHRKYYENEKIWYEVEIKNGNRLETQYDGDAHIIKQNTFEIGENITAEKFAEFDEK